MPFPPRIARAITKLFSREDAAERASRLHFTDAGHGFDRFGLHPDFVAMGDALTGPLYDHYFRVKSTGHENIPTDGAAVLACNHSGTLPLDGAMICVDVFRHLDPPRAPRAVADYFVSSLPIVGTLFARSGVVSGSRGNALALLEAGELLLIFPEGTPGIGKLYRDRYQLQTWRPGHCELAMRHGAPVVPVAVVGAEEQMPQIARIPIPGPVPYLPIPATLIPLPVRYHIYYGEPLYFEDADPDNPEDVAAAALEVKASVDALLTRGLAEREGVFA